jgi:hypothetical protein
VVLAHALAAADHVAIGAEFSDGERALMDYKKVAAYVLIGVGGADLLVGTTSTPLPIIGDYLTQQLDLVLIAAGVAILFL